MERLRRRDRKLRRLEVNIQIRHIERKTEKKKDAHMKREKDRKVERQTSRKPNTGRRQKDRENIDRQSERNIQTEREKDRQEE